MRFITPVYFQKVVSVYDSDSGNYTEEVINEDKRFARVTTASVESLRLFYGDIKQGGVVIRLQRSYTAAFDRIRIGGKFYNVDFSRQLEAKNTFIAKEVQNGEAQN